jgi:hypothetical protein
MQTWHSIIKRVLKMPPHKPIIVPIDEVQDPEKEGAVRTIGEIGVHKADYEFTLKDGRRVHIRKHKDYYEVHWDKVSPLVNAIEHLRQDAPHWWILLWTAGGAIMGALFHKKDRSTGAGIGALLGLLLGIITTL